MFAKHRLHNRRSVLKLGLMAWFAGILPRPAWADWNKPAFESKTLSDAYKALGVESIVESSDVQIIASDIAENGAVVPVQGISKLSNTQSITFLVEKNPNMLAAVFEISPEMAPDISTRIKMGQTSNVIVLVKADGRYFTASKEIKVTLGGCGG